MLPVRRPLAPLLFLNDNSASYQPIRKCHCGIDMTDNAPSRKDYDIPYVANAILRHRHRRRNFGRLYLLAFHRFRCVLYHNLRRAATYRVRPHITGIRINPRIRPRAARRHRGGKKHDDSLFHFMDLSQTGYFHLRLAPPFRLTSRPPNVHPWNCQPALSRTSSSAT